MVSGQGEKIRPLVRQLNCQTNPWQEIPKSLNPQIPKSPNPPPTIEVLPSDFAGNAAAVDRVVDAAPEVYNHNTETVPRLFPIVREEGGGSSRRYAKA